MAATFYITHRRMQMSSNTTHAHVGWVRLQSGTILTREDVFSWMHGGSTFVTRPPRGSGATVRRVHCRGCTSDYLRTDRDNTTADNLDELPKF